MPAEPSPHIPSSPDSDSTWFGYRQIGMGEKAALVQGVFSSVAGKYDLMNDLMSGGIHRLWKAAMLDWLNPRPGWNSLDVAGGTGDIAFRILERQPSAHVTICDLTPAMLEVGRDRAVDKGILHGLDWVSGNAEDLPFEEMQFDSYTIAFGLRNVGRQQQALAEAYRVLKPGGRFMCLEFSHVALPALAKLYDVYSFHVLPKLGEIVAKDRDSYQYLVESIRKFPTQDNLAAMMTKAGFRQVSYRNLTGGIAAIHSGWRV